MSGHSQPGTVGKLGRLTRRVKRNHARAMKARGKREKEMVMVAFQRGVNLGSDLFKAKILNATAGYEYEPTPEDQPVSSSVDPMSESTLASVAPDASGV